MGDFGTTVSTFSAAVAALAALATLVVAYLTFREGRATIIELKKLSQEAARETAAQEAIVASTQKLVQASNATATVIHSLFLEAQAAREVEALLRVRTALAEIASATQRVLVDRQPEFLFYVARQNLRAALAGIPDTEHALPVSCGIGNDGSIVQARQNELQADHEVDEALDAARVRVKAASLQSSEAMESAPDGMPYQALP
jgi:hypothetical protein